ncbi:MAG: peptide deformylase [Candidatus Omnitrophica bacterium]|nr:peptide deformylase [Candidatus Omnitrophota bacterium]
MKLRIHTWPEKILKKKTSVVENIDADIKQKLDEMLSLMRVSQGAGLAGNQAGLDLQLVVIEVQGKVYKLVNPVIIEKKGKIIFREGCLSFPGLELDIKRFKEVSVRALDDQGQELIIHAEDLLAVVLQHEIDHINGIAFVSRASLFQRIKTYPALRKIIKNTQKNISA